MKTWVSFCARGSRCLRRGADKSLAFPFFLFPAQAKEFFVDGIMKLEQRSHKCVELRGEYVEQIHFFNHVACCFLYKAKDLSAPLGSASGAKNVSNKSCTDKSNTQFLCLAVSVSERGP
jgi:hypothetical protein